MISAIFQYEFLQNTFLTGILIGLIAPLLGTFIVVRRLSLIADALSHVTLAGIAASLFLSKKNNNVCRHESTLLWDGIFSNWISID